MIRVWHNTHGIADQYFVCYGYKVLFQIPKFIGKIFAVGEKK